MSRRFYWLQFSRSVKYPYEAVAWSGNSKNHTYTVFIAAQSANASTQKRATLLKRCQFTTLFKSNELLKLKAFVIVVRVIIPLQDIFRCNMASATFVFGVCYTYIYDVRIASWHNKTFTHIIQPPLFNFSSFLGENRPRNHHHAIFLHCLPKMHILC